MSYSLKVSKFSLYENKDDYVRWFVEKDCTWSIYRIKRKKKRFFIAVNGFYKIQVIKLGRGVGKDVHTISYLEESSIPITV